MAAGRHPRRVGAGARQCPDGQRQSAAVAVRLRERVEELRVRHSASVLGQRRCPPPELFARSGDFPLATASGIDPAVLDCRGVPAWLPRLCRTWRRRLSSHRNTATPTARWRLRWILQSSEEPTDVVDVLGGRLHRREVPATVEVGPVSAGQRMDVHDMVDEIGCLISRSLCWETVTPGSRSGRPPSSGEVRGRQMNSVRRSRVLEMDVRARGCRPTGCGSLIRGGALCGFRRRVG